MVLPHSGGYERPTAPDHMMMIQSGQGRASTFPGLVSEQKLARPETNPQQQQQTPGPLQQQELLHQEFLPQQQRPHPTPARERYKSCDFCAKRKRKCSGGLPRCSLCIEKKQPSCHYQLKPVAKARANKQAAGRQAPSDSHGSFGARKRTVEAPEVAVHTSDLGVVTVAGVRSTAMVPRSMSLKRCRLSPSPATGLVGMQENGFLCDFFGCLGFLPLATESHVRQAMVEILLRASTSGRPQLESRLGNQGPLGNGNSITGAQQGGSGLGGYPPEGEEVGWNGSSGYQGYQAAAGSPARCMMWCAIALGALVKGAPIENVSEYIRRARESLADCFDGSSVENARAFVMMSFLHGVINDMEKNDKYLSFATSIVSKLGKDDVPKDLGSMLQTVNRMGVFRSPYMLEAGAETVVDAENTVDIPRVETIVQQKDLCNLFLIFDRRVKQAFFKDMLANGAIPDADVTVQRRRRGPAPVEQAPTGEQSGVGDGMALEGGGEGPRGVRPRELEVGKYPVVPLGWNAEYGPPPAGAATKRFIEEALPDMERLSKMPQRSDTFSGVGGLLYHSNLAYMKVVLGELEESFKSLEACVNVIVRYPGLVRFRTHLVHCTLAASQSAGRRDVYEVVRRVYNSVRPSGWTRVMPFEEWTSMSDICDFIFCRSAEVQMNIRHRQWLAKCHGAVPTPPPSASPGSIRSCCSERHPLEEPGLGKPQQATYVPPAPIGDTPSASAQRGGTNDEAAVAAVAPAGGGEDVRDYVPDPEPLATGARAPRLLTAAASMAVGDPAVACWSTVAPEVESALEPGMAGGGEPGSEEEMRLTDEDLLDAAAAFLGGEGFLENDLPL